MGTSIWLSSTTVGKIILYDKPHSQFHGIDGGGLAMTTSVPRIGKNPPVDGHGSTVRVQVTPIGTGVSPTTLGGTRTADTCTRTPVAGTTWTVTPTTGTG